MKKILLLIAFIMHICSLDAKRQDINFSHLGTEEGLSHYSASALYIDEYSTLWVGTREGLNRYQGSTVKTFHFEKNNPHGLMCSYVFSITGDRKGKIFLLTNEGVAEYNLRTERFRTLYRGAISGIYFKEKLYISGGDKIYTLNEQSQDFELEYQHPNSDIDIRSLYLDDNNTLWIGTGDHGVFTLSAKGELSSPINSCRIQSIYGDSNGNIWIGSWEHGLFRVARDGSIVQWQNDVNNPKSIASNFVRSCCEDDYGNIWIGTFKGLCRYRPESDSFDLYTADGSNGALSHSSIYSMVKDTQGTLWLGTYYGGVNYFNPEYEIYSHYTAGDSPQRGLSSNIVGRMSLDKCGKLWICTDGGGVNTFDIRDESFEWYVHSKGKNSVSHNNIKSIYCDPKQDVVWIGTYHEGLNKLDQKSGKISQYKLHHNRSVSVLNNIICDIIPHKDQLIIATQDGVFLFDPQTGDHKKMFQDLELGQDITIVTDIHIDGDGKLWISLEGDGILRYDFAQNTLKKYNHQVDNPNSLSSNSVNHITHDSGGDIWISTSGSGLDRYRAESDDFENFDKQKNGLSGEYIYQVCESAIYQDRLLLITSTGLSIFDTKKQRFVNYGTESGFPITTINENGLFVTDQGQVFIGGVNGLLSFNEQTLEFKPKPYAISLTNLTVNGHQITVGDQSGILENSLNYTSEINLSDNRRMFSVEYTTSNYLPIARDSLVYRLEGLSDEWNHISRGQTVISYANLTPAEYTLVIKAQREDVKEARLKINVLPNWYETWWSKLLYISIIATLLTYLFRTYKQRLQLRESIKYERQKAIDAKELNQFKINFFANISHEFRTTLTLITGNIEILMHIQTYSTAVYNKILSIYKSSMQMRGLITELLDFEKQEVGYMKAKARKHDIVEFLYENYLIYHDYICNKQVSFEFIKQEESIEVWYDQSQMQKVINNLLSNAVKHTSANDTITMSISLNEQSVRIEVTDSGSGIKAEDINKIFDCYYQTERVDSLTSAAGTGIGLALTKGLVEANHGEIFVESTLGKGSRFVVDLKLGNKHFTDEEILYDHEAIKPISLPQDIAAAIVDETALNKDIAAPASRNIKLLIAEDNQSVRELLIEIFSPYYHVISACDGVEALKMVYEHTPTIVVSDVVMPNMLGTELCKRIKDDIEICHTKVVLLTARTSVQHTVEGLHFGADDYITKPFDVNILVARCNNLVNSYMQIKEKFTKQPQVNASLLATNPLDKKVLDSAISIIENHLDDTDFNVNIFAREIGMARTALFKKLKNITGQTPNDFILNIRLKKGAQMLRENPELSILEISEIIGFSSARYFSKCFKEMYNISPLAYRKEQ